MPVFCTAEIPAEIIEDFLQNSVRGREWHAEDYRPALITTTDVQSIVTSSETAPAAAFSTPFLNWTTDEVYQFFLLNIQPLGSEIRGDWTAHTFVILDARTAVDRTCFLCSDVPDYLERERVILKCVRSMFDQVLAHGMLYETFNECPSESGDGVLATGEVLKVGKAGNGMHLSFMPRPFSAEDKRAVASWGIINSTVSKGRRWWDRYEGEEGWEEIVEV